MKSSWKGKDYFGRVERILICPSKDKIPKSVSEGILIEDRGFIGDKHSSSGNRQVTLLSAKARNMINTVESDGLCTKKFYENLTIKDLDISRLIIGQRITIGSVELEITEIGKRCFPECDIVKKLQTCSLKNGVVFAKVISGGVIRIGDTLIIEDKC